MTDNKIVIICAYFGRLPATFRAWLRSCKANENFSWLLVTDDEEVLNYEIPANLRIIRESFEQFRKRVSSRFDFSISLNEPYKICDFKAAFGLIFEEEISGYLYWGHCDLDVVWGSLASFFPDQYFGMFDRLQECGHLIFYRNTDRVNRAFMSQSLPHLRYQDVFADRRTHLFDEWGGMHNISYAAGLTTKWVRAYFDVRPDFHDLRNTDGVNYKRQILYWEDGRVFREFIVESDNAARDTPIIERDEFCYVHLQKRAMIRPGPEIDIARGFYITPNAFVTKEKRQHCRDDFLRLNPRKLIYRPKIRAKRALEMAKLELKELLN